MAQSLSRRMIERFKGTAPGQAARRVVRFSRWVRECAVDSIGLARLAVTDDPGIVGTPFLSLQQWKRELEKLPPATGQEILLFAIQNRTWVEWMVWAAAVFRSMGYRPVVVYSGQTVSRIYEPAGFGVGLERFGGVFWKHALATPQIGFLDLDDFVRAEPSLEAEYAAFSNRAAHMIAAYDLEVEEFEPEDLAAQYDEKVREAEAMLTRYTPALHRVLGQFPSARAVAPNGQIGLSTAILEVANRRNVRAAFVEAWCMRPGHMVWNFNRAALDYDVRGWLSYLGKLAPDAEAEADRYMRFQERAHMSQNEGWLKDYRPVQRSNTAAPFPAQLETFLARPGATFLMGTNVVGDSATLGRATIFKSQKDWVQQVVAFFREHPELNLVFRAHPDEVTIRARRRMGDVAAQAAGGADNVFVIPGESDVSSYALMARVRCGLAWVSNVGLDMALRDLPVVIAANAAYSGLGIVREAQTREGYFEELLSLAESPVGPSPEAIALGKLYQRVLTRTLSLQANERGYSAGRFRLRPGRMTGEQHKFFRILAGELDDKGREK